MFYPLLFLLNVYHTVQCKSLKGENSDKLDELSTIYQNFQLKNFTQL